MNTYDDTPTCLGVSLANVLIFSRTTLMPLSSEAFNSSTRARNKSGLDLSADFTQCTAESQLTQTVDERGRGSYLAIRQLYDEV